jgi:murein L,D-transpeptidase YcbB/YkuD
LVNEPEVVNAPANALECGVADFIICGCLAFAQADDVSGVTVHLKWWVYGPGQAKTVAGALENRAGQPKSRVAQHNVAAGLAQQARRPPLLYLTGSYGPVTAGAVKDFQESQGLDADGKVGPETMAAIDAALLAL